MASYFRRHQSSWLPLWEPQILSNDVKYAIIYSEVTSGSVVGVDMSSDNIGGPLAVRVFSVRGGAKLPARARRAESDLDVL